MKKSPLLLPILVFLLLSCERNTSNNSAAIVENSRTLPEITRILFIGNSHTNRNNIPETIQLMAASAGDSTYCHNETQPGYTLGQHCGRRETLNTIDSLEWDFVVLQEQGGHQAFPSTIIDTGVYQYAQIMVDAIRNNSSKTIIILYMTHAYKEGVLTFGSYDWAALDPQVAAYEGMQDRIRDNNLIMQERYNVEMSPAGVLWKIFQHRYPSVNLFNPDHIHPLPNGSYLLACAIYSSIFTKRPNGKYIPDNVNYTEGVNMQNLVYETMFNLDPDWRTY